MSFIARPFCDQCGMPFAETQPNEARCATCLHEPPPFAHARAVLEYTEESRELILAFKHGDRTDLAPAFAAWLARTGAELGAEADLLLPVPLHPLRLWVRRYNQAALLAQFLARQMGKPYLPDALRRHRRTPPQGSRKGHNNRKARHANVKGAFSLNPARLKEVQGRTILLIDDVYTTGATVSECARVLVHEGAAKVNVLTLFRAPE